MIDRLILIDRSRLLFRMDVCRSDIDLSDVFTFLPAVSALRNARCGEHVEKLYPFDAITRQLADIFRHGLGVTAGVDDKTRCHR